MKKELILGSFLAFAAIGNSQNTFPSTGNAGIGTLSPAYPLDVYTRAGNDGVRINNNNYLNNGSCGLFLRNAFSASLSKEWQIWSLGTGNAWGAGNFCIVGAGDPAPQFFINSATGNVGMGTPLPAYKLGILANTPGDNGLQAVNSGAGAAGLFLNNTYVSSPGKNWGILSKSGGDLGIKNVTDNLDVMTLTSAGKVIVGNPTGTSSSKLQSFGISSGIYGEASNISGPATGVYGFAVSGVNTSGVATGVYGFGGGSKADYGGYFEVDGAYPSGCVAGTTNYGIFARVVNPGCSGAYAGVFQGAINVDGNIDYTGSLNNVSDRKFKKEIKPLTAGMDKIKALNPSIYLFRRDEFAGINFPKQKQFGLIAQELELVFPELVSDIEDVYYRDKDGTLTGTLPAHKSVNYIGLIPVLISGVQEQQAQIETQQTQIESQQKTIAQQTQINADLQKQLDEQKELINGMKNSTATGINAAGNVETGFQMSQNEPNPFTHETIVKYTLPQSVNNAFMAVYDLTGKQIATFPIQQKGASSLTITSEKLSAGIYIYSIVADGKVVDSKRMIVADK